MDKKIVLSGSRPTGNIHLGNYFGAVSNWVKLQEEYDCNFFIADWHALTTGYADTADLRKNSLSLAADYLASGLDPKKCTIFLQSLVKQHSELFLLLSMNTPLAWLERCPTYKDQLANIKDRDITTYGFLGYPALMAADILMYKADYVPVGEDQVPHLELAREMSRRFNFIYGREVFPEPAPLFTKSKVLPGTDGRKMSKSYGNTISLSDTPDDVLKKIRGMVTDPARIRKDDPGHPEVCSVYAFHKVFSEDKVDDICAQCKKGEIGCVACKKMLSERVAEFQTPIYEKRLEILSHEDTLIDIIKEGSAKAAVRAEKTMEDVRSAIKFGF
ncbi:MAG TPA: tryptophan--tRNA ligase [Saccharofermentans sp.]|nr:tryptophan--tRNA ligase [Saccharofermentans sp.]HPQ31674.1 tryptophan--tRNA ligase [Saccharofermentans sp.]